MAIFVTLFAAAEAELDRLFPGWARAPDRPQRVTIEDPDTGEERTLRRWMPAPGESEGFAPPRLADCSPPVAPILAPESDYERHMEERAPAVLCTLPHACVKNLSGQHLDALASIVLGRAAEGRPARVTPDGFAIESLDEEAVGAVATMEQEALPELAARWSREARGFEGAGDALWVLRRVHALARLCAGTGRKLCLWAET